MVAIGNERSMQVKEELYLQDDDDVSLFTVCNMCMYNVKCTFTFICTQDDNGTNATCVTGETTKGRPKKRMANVRLIAYMYMYTHNVFYLYLYTGTNATCVGGETTKWSPKKQMANVSLITYML